MVLKKPKATESKRICIYFTEGQLDLIRKIIEDGEFGKNPVEVIKGIVLQYCDKHHIRD